MRVATYLGATLLMPFLSVATVVAPVDTPSKPWPMHDNGLNDVVQWDHYSFKVNGKRLFVFSGELHYWRIPVPEVWEDLLEKIKAAGFTAFAFYGHWGYHSPNNRTLDFTAGAHDFTKLFEIAKRVGLYVIVRPGPYVNAETNAGGFPLWLTTGAYGELRNDDPRYEAAWTPYFAEFSRLTSKHLVSNGGNALVYQIENEYGEQWKDRASRIPNWDAARYMAALGAAARKNGIDIPLIHNDPNMNTKSWSHDYAPNASANVDVAGVDSYPSCWSCNLEECTGTNGKYVAYQVINYYDFFREFSPTQPSFFPEFQGGSYNPWGGPEGGCPSDIGSDFANLFYRNLISQRVTAISLYMMYGGTNWGALACPVTATSYDYSSPISEDRSIGNKYYETKNLALFTRVAEDLTMTDRVANNTGYTTNSAVTVSELRNPETNGAFYVAIHSYSPSATKESFEIHVKTLNGALTIPRYGGSIVLDGHQSKILVTDFRIGNHILTYSTAEVLTYAIIDGAPVVILWAGIGESVEFHLKDARNVDQLHSSGPSKATYHSDAYGVAVNVNSVGGMAVFLSDNGIRVIVADQPTAYLFWAPNLSNDPLAPANQSVLVQGPYLVRGVSVDAGTLHIKGDIGNATSIEVLSSKSIRSISWNGKTLTSTKTEYGSIRAYHPGMQEQITMLSLASWKVHDALPERLFSYNDSGLAWVDANHLTTPNPTKPDTLPVLYVDDYDIHNSFHLFRGYFDGYASAVRLSLQGGLAFGWSAWLNGHALGSYLGNSTSGTGNLTLEIPADIVHANGTNIILITQDNTGHDLRAAAIQPRGILHASLVGGATFSKWKIAGTAGRDDVQLDAVRGPLNEGGLVAERVGWHLPGFDDSSWSEGSPVEGFKGGPGIRFYRTVVPLHIPRGVDVSLAFVFRALETKKMRVQLFVNGYQYGRFNPYVGNERKFPVPPGVLNYAGQNTIGLVVWAQSEEEAKLDVELKLQYAVESSWSANFDGEYLRPGWNEQRMQYA